MHMCPLCLQLPAAAPAAMQVGSARLVHSPTSPVDMREEQTSKLKRRGEHLLLLGGGAQVGVLVRVEQAAVQVGIRQQAPRPAVLQVAAAAAQSQLP